MDRAELIEREARYGRTAGVLGIIGAILLLVLTFGGIGGDFYSIDPGDYAARLEVFDSVRNEVLAAQLLQALGLLLLAPPLLFLFQAAMFRSPTVRRPFQVLTVLGPVLYAIALILFYFAYDSAASTFADSTPTGANVDQFAEDTLTQEGAYATFLGLQLAAALSMVFAVIYTSLQAMRAGLLTRFLGTLGMALGVGFLLFGPLGPLALALYVLTISLLIAGWWRGPRPPAWEAGVAIPWPKSGEKPAPPEEELATPEDFEGSGREIETGEGPAEDWDASGESGSDSDAGGRPRKRKRRG